MNKFNLPPPLLFALITLTLGVVTYFALDDVILDRARFFMLTLLVLQYLCVEINRLRRINPNRWLLDPVVICSMFTFALPFGITNILFLLPDDLTIMVGNSSVISPSMLKVMLLVLLAVTALWLGYWSRFATKLAYIMASIPLLARINQGDFQLKIPSVYISLGAVILVRLSMVTLGIYGYSSDAGSLAATASFRQYLTFSDSLAKFILMAMSLHFFSSPVRDKTTRGLLTLIILVETLFGFLSGFKSTVVMPVVLLGVCYYYCTNTLKVRYVVTTCLLLSLAYFVIEPFRVDRHSRRDFTNTSLLSITGTMIDSVLNKIDYSENNNNFNQNPSVLLLILERSSLAYIASLGVAYKDSDLLPENAPHFLRDIFLSPLYAVIPRALWEGKEMSRHGQWYAQEVMRLNLSTTSVGMSPITYLYFAGGWLAVCLGFLFVGIVQRAVSLALMEYGGVVYLALLMQIASVNSVYYVFILDLIRYSFVISVFFILLYRRRVVPDAFANRSRFLQEGVKS